MDPFEKAAAYQRDALDSLLDALDLDHAGDEIERTVRVYALAQGAHELIRANQRLRRRVAELERAVAPDDEEMEALARAAEERETIAEHDVEDI